MAPGPPTTCRHDACDLVGCRSRRHLGHGSLVCLPDDAAAGSRCSAQCKCTALSTHSHATGRPVSQAHPRGVAARHGRPGADVDATQARRVHRVVLAPPHPCTPRTWAPPRPPRTTCSTLTARSSDGAPHVARAHNAKQRQHGTTPVFVFNFSRHRRGTGPTKVSDFRDQGPCHDKNRKSRMEKSLSKQNKNNRVGPKVTACPHHDVTSVSPLHHGVHRGLMFLYTEENLTSWSPADVVVLEA